MVDSCGPPMVPPKIEHPSYQVFAEGFEDLNELSGHLSRGFQCGQRGDATESSLHLTWGH